MGSLDPLRSRFSWRPAQSDENPTIEPLTPESARDLRLPWLSRFDPTRLRACLEANPGMSLWVPATGEYAVGERWRRRDDIANIIEVTARRGKIALVREMTALLEGQGAKLVLLAEDAWHDQQHIYATLGFGLVETIVFFQRDLRSWDPTTPHVVPPHLDITQAAIGDLDAVLAVDNDSFPWFWWNNADEMGTYMLMDNVTTYLAHHAGVPVGYASFTMHNGWAHLDRLAVRSANQGKRFGAAQLHYAMRRMVEMGASSVALSTQENNTQSHALYIGFGFKQTREKMHLYGRAAEHAAQGE